MTKFERNLKRNILRAFAMTRAIEEKNKELKLDPDAMDELAAQCETIAAMWLLVGERAKGMAVQMMEDDDGDDGDDG